MLEAGATLVNAILHFSKVSVFPNKTFATTTLSLPHSLTNDSLFFIQCLTTGLVSVWCKQPTEWCPIAGDSRVCCMECCLSWLCHAKMELLSDSRKQSQNLGVRKATVDKSRWQHKMDKRT